MRVRPFASGSAVEVDRDGANGGIHHNTVTGQAALSGAGVISISRTRA